MAPMGLSIVAVLLASVMVISAVHAAANGGPQVSTKRFTFPRKTTSSLAARGHARSGGIGVTESPTDPPSPSQPEEFLVSFSDFCTGKLQLASFDYSLWSGNYTVPPPPIVPIVNSGEFNYGFAVTADPMTGIVNGSLMYTCPNCTTWPTDIPLEVAFASVEGEWVFEISYWTPLLPLIMSSDIGPRAVYNILVGHRFDIVRC